jgi:hypothetical protein
MIEPYKITDKEKVCETKFLALKTATYIDKNGKEAKWDYVTRQGDRNVVTMACRNDKGQYPVIRQSRIPVDGKIVYSFPAGVIEEGSSVEEMVAKEMKEETGYEVDEITSISPYLPKSSGLTNESSALVKCKLGKKGEQELEETENIIVEMMTPRNVIKLGKSLDPDKYMISNDLWSFMAGKIDKQSIWTRLRNLSPF